MKDSSTLLHVFSLIGVGVFAASGAIAAGRRRFDLIGVMVIALATAVGGGTLRDVLLHRRIFWIEEPTNLYVALIAAGFTIIWVRFWKPPYTSLVVADALGLALFSILGAQRAEAAGTDGIVVVFMGTITGVAGGVIRDILCAEVPLVFRDTETLYATAAIAGVTLYLVAQTAGAPRVTAGIAGMILIAAIRAAAIIWRLKLPVVRVDS